MKTMLLSVLVVAAALWPGTEPGGADDAVSFVQRLQWHHRVVLVVADEANLPQLEVQAERLAADRAALAAEQVVLVTIRPDGVRAGNHQRFDAEAGRRLRAFYDLENAGFAVLLIGRDGGEKARFTDVVDPGTLLAEVDEDVPAPERGESGVLVL